MGAFRSEHAVFSVRERGTARNSLEDKNAELRGTNTQNDAEIAPHPNPLPGGERGSVERGEEMKFIAYNTEGRHRAMEEFTYDPKHPFVKYFSKNPMEIIIKDEFQREVEETHIMKHEPRSMKHNGKKGRSADSVDIRLKQGVLKEMQSHDFAVVFPVLSKEELVGIFGLGDKKSGDIYTTQDLNLIDLYAHQVGIAIENAKLYSDLKRFNERLRLGVEIKFIDLFYFHNIASGKIFYAI